MQDWLKNNGLQLAIMAAGMLLAWAALNARVSVVESKVSEYPSQDWFDLKFEEVGKRFDRIEEAVDGKIDK